MRIRAIRLHPSRSVDLAATSFIAQPQNYSRASVSASQMQSRSSENPRFKNGAHFSCVHAGVITPPSPPETRPPMNHRLPRHVARFLDEMSVLSGWHSLPSGQPPL